MNSIDPLFVLSIALIDQIITLLNCTLTSSAQLTHESTLIPGSTIGKHLRHVHDHFRLLLDALVASGNDESEEEESVSNESSSIPLSYDTRSRNLPSESLHAAALESFVSLRGRLEREMNRKRGRGWNAKRRMTLTAVIPTPIVVETSVGREVGLFAPQSFQRLADVHTRIRADTLIRIVRSVVVYMFTRK